MQYFDFNTYLGSLSDFYSASGIMSEAALLVFFVRKQQNFLSKIATFFIL